MSINKLTLGFSILNIIIFLLPIVIIGFADFSNNLGTSKGVVIFSFILLNFIFLLPALGALFVRRNRPLISILFGLNIFCLGWLLYQLIPYLK